MAALQYCPCRDRVGINTDNTFLTTWTIMRFTRPPFGIRGGPHTVKLRIPGHLEYFVRLSFTIMSCIAANFTEIRHEAEVSRR